MIVSYCKKCKIDSEGTTCSRCGKHASSSQTRDVWRTVRVPGADTGAWRSAITVIGIVALLLLTGLLVLERLTNTDRNLAAASGIIISSVAVCAVIAILVVALAFALQGREEIRFTLDMEGAHTQTWHRAGYLRSWARLQHADMKSAVRSRDGTYYVKCEERHILWRDVNQTRYSPASGTIRLYHTPHLAPFVLRLPPEEYAMAEALVKKHSKNR